MYSAIDEQDLRFHLVHEPDGGRIGYQKICKAENEPVPDDEIVKAFEFEKDEMVVLTDEDFAAAKTEGVKTIEISDFVPYEEIDPIYFERTYYLGPQDGSEKVYGLLREAMEQTELAALGKYVMRDRQHLGCLRVREGTITLEKMFFHDEIRPVEDIAPGKVKVGKAELDMATSLIEQFKGEFEPEKYEDTYREALMDVIRAKRKGETITAAPVEEEEEPADLLAALRASVEAAKKGRGAVRAKRPPARKSSATRKKPAARKKKTASKR
jgi:DNA end-binding protein Ku